MATNPYQSIKNTSFAGASDLYSKLPGLFDTLANSQQFITPFDINKLMSMPVPKISGGGGGGYSAMGNTGGSTSATFNPAEQALYDQWLAGASGQLNEATAAGSGEQVQQMIRDKLFRLSEADDAQAKASLESRLQNMGMLGSIGGAGQMKALLDAQSKAGIQRDLTSWTEGQNYLNNLYNRAGSATSSADTMKKQLLAQNQINASLAAASMAAAAQRYAAQQQAQASMYGYKLNAGADIYRSQLGANSNLFGNLNNLYNLGYTSGTGMFNTGNSIDNQIQQSLGGMLSLPQGSTQSAMDIGQYPTNFSSMTSNTTPPSVLGAQGDAAGAGWNALSNAAGNIQWPTTISSAPPSMPSGTSTYSSGGSYLPAGSISTGNFSPLSSKLYSW